MPLFSALQDDFQTGSIDTGRWPAQYNASIGGGQLRLSGDTPDGDESYIQSAPIYGIAGSSIYARVLVDPTKLSTGHYFQFSVHRNPFDWAGYRIKSDALWTVSSNGGGINDDWNHSFPYDLANRHLWLRIRNDGVAWYFETWTSGGTIYSHAAPQVYFNNTATMYARLAVYSTTAVAWVDNVNVNSALGTSSILLPGGLQGTETITGATLNRIELGPAGLRDLDTLGATQTIQPGTVAPATIIDLGALPGAGAGQPNSPFPAGIIDLSTVGNARLDSFGIGPAGVTNTSIVGQPTLTNTRSAGYGDDIYGTGVYGGNPNTLAPIGITDADAVTQDIRGGADGGPSGPTTGYGSGNYSDGVYSGTPTDPNKIQPAGLLDGELLYGDDSGDAYGSGPYGRGAYQSRNIGNTNSGYGSGIYGDGVYQGTVKQPGGAATPATLPITRLWPNPVHILGIGPWNPTKVWHGAVNYGIGRGLAPARPVMQLPGITAKSVTLRLAGGDEATVTCQFATTDAVIVREMATDLWWLRKDPRSGQLDMLGRFNCSHNDLTRADDGLLSSSLQFQDWKIVLGNRMVLKYLKPNTDPPESQWAKGTSITEILKFAIPNDTGIDLSILDKEDVLGNTTEAYHLPPYNTIDQTIEALLAISPKPWEWWIDTTSDFAYPPKLMLATQRGTDRGVTLFDLGAGTSPIASWQMRATSDNYANTIYFQGGGVNNTAAGGVVRTFAADVAEVGERDVQVSDNSIVGALANYTAAADKALKPLADRRPTFTITLKAGFWRGRHHIDVGDTVRVRIKLGKELLAYTYRVSEIHVDIDATGSETVALTLGNPLASANPRSQYSPVFKLVRTLRNYTPPVGSTS